MSEQEAIDWMNISMDSHAYEIKLNKEQQEKIYIANALLMSPPRFYHLKQRCNAIRMLTFDFNGDCAGFIHVENVPFFPEWTIDPVREFSIYIIRFLACICLITGRSGVDDYTWHDMGGWDYRRTYGGWEAMFLSFSLRQFRYQIYDDGDWEL